MCESPISKATLRGYSEKIEEIAANLASLKSFKPYSTAQHVRGAEEVLRPPKFIMRCIFALQGYKSLNRVGKTNIAMIAILHEGFLIFILTQAPIFLSLFSGATSANSGHASAATIFIFIITTTPHLHYHLITIPTATTSPPSTPTSRPPPHHHLITSLVTIIPTTHHHHATIAVIFTATTTATFASPPPHSCHDGVCLFLINDPLCKGALGYGSNPQGCVGFGRFTHREGACDFHSKGALVCDLRSIG
nr:hypothetical protein [Tanacetum cinerariifolium]